MFQYLLDEIRPIEPSDSELTQVLNQSKVTVQPREQRVDMKAGQKFAVGDLVLARSYFSRFGAQLGTIVDILEDGSYRVGWTHLVGRNPRDSKRSYTPRTWAREDLISAEVQPALSSTNGKILS